jgi:hypothetical protein
LLLGALVAIVMAVVCGAWLARAARWITVRARPHSGRRAKVGASTNVNLPARIAGEVIRAPRGRSMA